MQQLFEFQISDWNSYHEIDEEAEIMELKEKDILNQFGIKIE